MGGRKGHSEDVADAGALRVRSGEAAPGWDTTELCRGVGGGGWKTTDLI